MDLTSDSNSLLETAQHDASPADTLCEANKLHDMLAELQEREDALSQAEARLAKLESLRAELDAQRRELYAERESLDGQRREITAMRAEAGRQFAERDEELRQREAEVQMRQESLERREQTLAAQLDRPQANTANDEMPAASAENPDLPEKRNEDATAASVKAIAPDSESETVQAVNEDVPTTNGDSPSDALSSAKAETSETAAPRPPRMGAPVDLAEILRKQGFSMDDDSPAEESPKSLGRESRTANDRILGGAASELADRTEPTAAAGGKSSGGNPAHGSDEESIDDYMSKLLARSRGGEAPSGPSPAPSPAKPVGPGPSAKKAQQKAAAIAATQAARAVLEPAPSTMIVDGALAPRAVAPEKNININAIRELANLSATTALISHQQKKTAVNSQAKLIVTVVSFVLGVVLIVVSRLPHANGYTLYWALASFSVSMIWGIQFARLFSTQLVERAARFERHVKRTNEAAAQAAADAAKADGEPDASASG